MLDERRRPGTTAMPLRAAWMVGWFACPLLGQGTSVSRSGVDAPLESLGPTRSALSFLDNRERWPEEPCFLGSAAGMRIGLAPDAIYLLLAGEETGKSAIVRMGFEGGSTSVELEPLDPEPGLYHFFVGSDRSKWRRNLRRYRAVRCRGLYPGVDLVLRGEEAHFEYDLVVAPGADLDLVTLRFEGIESLAIDPEGCVVLDTPLGSLRQIPGKCWQEEPDGRREVLAFSFRRLDDYRLAFVVAGRDPGMLLTIDPGLVWSTYLGGKGGGPSLGDVARAIALDSSGNVTVTGTSEGGIGEVGQFPMTPGTFQAPSMTPGTDISGEDVFVTRFREADGALVYSSVIGGAQSHEDRAFAIDVDSSGRAAVAGTTQSPDFPTTPGAWDTTFTNFLGSFVFRLSATGDDLEYSTFLEGDSNGTEVFAVGILDSGSVIVAGRTTSLSFPTTPGALDTTYGGFGDGFLTQLDPTGGSLEWSTFLGGLSLDQVNALTIDPQGSAVITGITGSVDFPVTPGAYDTNYGSAGDAFVTRIDAAGARILWSTFLGGLKADTARAIAVEGGGGIVVGGDTMSTDFPTTPGAFQPNFIIGMPSTSPEAFITRFDPTGSGLVYSTFFGGPTLEAVTAVSVDSSGIVTAAGSTLGPIAVTPGAFDDDANGAGKDSDGFVFRLDPSGARLFYSTRLGGTGIDELSGIQTSATGGVSVTGYSRSPDYPTTSTAFQPRYTGGDAEAVVTTMDLVLRGVRQFGVSVPSCIGPVVINATEMPVEGDASFGIYCSSAPPLASGWLLVSIPGIQAVTSVAAELEQALPPPIAMVPIQSDAAGYGEVSIPISPGTKGMRFSARCFFTNPPACPGSRLRSVSNGLLITVQ
jgi:hypothetical protein